MAELSAIYFQLNQLENGMPYLDAVMPISDQYSEAEKKFIAALLYFYGNKLQAKQKDKADYYHAKMIEPGYSSDDFKNWR